jgi:hypothetical protein
MGHRETQGGDQKANWTARCQSGMHLTRNQ